MEKSNKSFTESLSHLKVFLQNINKKEITEDEINSSLDEIDNLQTIIKGIKKLFIILFSLVICLIILLIITFSYNQKLNNFQDDIKSLKDDSLVIKILDVKKTKVGDSITTTYDYFTENGQPVKYRTLKKENDSLLSIIINNNKEEISQLEIKKNIEIEKSNLSKKLDLVFRNYPIKFKETDDKITIESKEIDSAMILLKQFRHKMKYNKQTDTWTVSFK
ncbi:hypothetical protein EGH90_00060 [Kaistella haifensis]|nr:hypothetical protein EGH90_00060 [Kaistella haifensis]